MKKVLVLLVALGVLLSPSLLRAEEEVWKLQIGEETYLVTKVEETGLRYIPETTDFNVLSDNMAAAVQVNPVSLSTYVNTQIDFWFEVLKRFLKTAKPMVAFKHETYPGLQITIYEQPKWVATWGKVYQIEDGEIQDQPSFFAVEARDFPVLSGLAEIFKKLRPGVMYVDKKFWFQLSYELTEE